MLKLHKNGKIKYNHPKLTATQEYKSPENNWEQRINKAQSKNSNSEDYINQEATYIPKDIAKKFVKEFHRNLTQGHNRATALVARLQEKYIIHRIWGIARKVIGKCPDCQRNKLTKHKPYGILQPVETPNKPWEVIS